uniref:Cytochrome b n=1 Tax=Ascoschoengastia sp. TATW-1 TaxID=436354 RepID=B3IUM4_9ACAR|nr:cytochrome b protein [Ascoschoengastia sp. TATW-1]
MNKRLNSVVSFSPMLFKNLINLPTPSSINYLWNMGSMLGFVLVFQILTGLFLSMHYNTELPFESVLHISRDVWMGSETRFLHSNGASLFFIIIYIHVGRGLFNLSYKKLEVWITGVMMLLILMGTAFLGYVLPWGQMSFWGATVITNLASAIPFLGESLVQWLWGGYSVSTPTLNRFLTLHFLFPFLLVGLAILHLISLHKMGSSNPIGTNSNQEKMSFNPLFSWKDLLFPLLIFIVLFMLSSKFPYLLMDPDNFSTANPMSTPVHIQPEWYFLFAYALLRSIPNKLGGVIVLVLSIISLLFIPLKKGINKISKFNMISKLKLSMLFIIFVVLTWLGGVPMESPYMDISKMMGPLYFMFMLF